MATHSNYIHARAPHNSDDEDASRRSRARVSRACTRCRTRKDKCDGGQPECSNCTNAKQPCLYIAGTKKRGLPEGYVRGLEKLWALMLHKVDGLDNAVRRVIDEHEEELLRIWNHQKLGEDLHTVWKDSSVLADLERLLSQIDHAPSELKRKRDKDQSETTTSLRDGPSDTSVLMVDFKVIDASENTLSIPTQSIEASSEWPAQVPQLDTVPTNGDGRRISLQSPVGIPSNQHIALPPPTTSSVNLDLEKTSLPALTPSLLDQYFTYTHCWIPILDRPHILKKFYEYTRSRNLVQLGGGELACLWAICAYSYQQTKHLPSPSQQGHNDTVASMRAVARSLIPSERGPFAFGHVQALLLLALLDIGLGEWTSAWMLVGYAVRAVLEMKATHGMPPDRQATSDFATSFAGQGNGADSGSTPVRRGRWQALLQGCFILDTMISYHLARPPQLRGNHLDLGIHCLVDEDGHEEWQPWIDSGRDAVLHHEPAFVMSCFNRLTELCVITSQALEAALYETTPASLSSQEAVSQLNLLSERYPFDINKITQRPLHQMLLQAWHSTIKMSLTTNYTRDRLLAADVSVLHLKHFDEAWNLPDKCGVPSILTSLLDTHSEERRPQLTGAQIFREGSLEPMISRLVGIWPGIRSELNRSPGFASAPFPDQPAQNSTSMSHITAPLLAAKPSLPPMPRSSLDALASSLKQSNIPTFENCNNDPFSQRDLRYPGHVPSDYEPMSIDSSNQNQMAFDPTLAIQSDAAFGPATSPSFNGDEIDALFHEMAQLDTTQWTMGRTQALRDFGFADDSTFEAFCNDPARLMLSDAFMGPAFNHGETTRNPATDSRSSMINQSSASHGKMSFEDLFR